MSVSNNQWHYVSLMVYNYFKMPQNPRIKFPKLKTDFP